jgi:hypothetical protein
MTGRSTVAGILVAALVPVASASAKSGDDDRVRATGTCGGGVRSTLELKADDGAIEVEFKAEHARRGSSWRVTLAQEGRVVWRGTIRARGGSGQVRLERRVRDLAGADRVSVRALGPRGVACRAAATLAGD